MSKKTWIGLEEGFGARARANIDRILTVINPYILVFIPNFKAAHYFYLILWTIIGSIFIYPVKNMRYIDSLFFSTACTTQSGLNTVDLNELVLWQQICFYFITTFTTPIFIHGSLLFIRLWGFERYFDNIKQTSKMNHRMRRNATLGSRTRSEDMVNFNTRVNTDYNLQLGDNTNIPMVPLHEPKFDESHEANISPPSSSTQETRLGDVEHMSEPSDDEAEVSPTESKPAHIHFSANTRIPRHDIELPLPTHDHSPLNESGIRFGNLPMPQRRNYEVAPSEMYRSIEMLHKNNPQNSAQADDDDDDEVLIIKSPNQIENEDGSRPIFTRKGKEHPRLKQKFKKEVRKRFKKMRTMSMNSIEDENNSINSDEDEGLDTMLDHDEEAIGATSEDSEHDDDSCIDHVRRATSNLALPSSDQTGGKKYAKRANTFDARDEEPTPKHQHKRTGRRFNLTPRVSMQSADEEYSLSSPPTRSFSRTLTNTLSRLKTANYLSWEPTIGRNSNFVHLTDEQKAELGGVEYRAIKLLIRIVWTYYIGLHIIAMIAHLGWIMANGEMKQRLREYGVSPVWWAFFTAQTSFNDLGLTLTPNSMIDFNHSIYVMLWGCFLIVAGNTGFPVFLRFIIWVLYKFAKPASLFEESLGFLLDHPRRCFTLLFPSGPTWWLFAILIVLNGIDWIFFIILDLNNTYLEKIPTGYRVVCGLYNAVTTRTAGLSTIDLSELHAAVQVSYLIMMYISVMPLAISIRRTNVYEEQSLGIYIKDKSAEMEDEKSPSNFIGNHLRNQLSFDLWFVFLGLFIVCIAENSKLEKSDIRFTAFSVLFECVSAYGTVGLSLGYPSINASLTGKFTVLSKLVIIAMMIRGRHRGLPYTLDRAIMLPNDDMLRRDRVQEHHEMRRQETLERTNTQATNTATGTGSELFKALSRRGNEILRRRRSTVPGSFS